MRIVWAVLPVAVLLEAGCSVAAPCAANENCSPFRSPTSDSDTAASDDESTAGEGDVEVEENRYLAVLAEECESLCTTLDSCDEGIFTSKTMSCAESCVGLIDDDRYWNCEPLFRHYMICTAQMASCDTSECFSILSEFDDCFSVKDELPPSANSCALANNGVCDEPEMCLTGSDTNDCSM